MTATKIIEQAAAEGVRLVLSGSGAIKASGPRRAVLRWQALLREHKPAIVAALSAANDARCHLTGHDSHSKVVQGADDRTSPRHLGWHVEIPGRPAFETIVFPEVSREWMQKFYPTATRIEPIEEPPRRRATAVEVAELAALVDVVLVNESAAVRREALDLALTDAANAVLCYRSLASATEPIF